jgi:hypothetical protein
MAATDDVVFLSVKAIVKQIGQVVQIYGSISKIEKHTIYVQGPDVRIDENGFFRRDRGTDLPKKKRVFCALVAL